MNESAAPDTEVSNPAGELATTDSGIADTEESSNTMEFNGSGREFFRIWMVNALLSLITLGIYSPWASVRNRCYLYGNTILAGHGFDFHGSPMAILRGRILTLLLLVAIYFGGVLNALVSPALVVVLIFIYPWILVKAFRFKLANSSYRNLRFGFDCSIGEAYRQLWPVQILALTAFGLFQAQGILINADTGALKEPAQFSRMMLFFGAGAVVAACTSPLLNFRSRSLQINHCRYGNHFFSANLKLASFWKAFLKSVAAALLGLLLATICVMALSFLLIDPAAGSQDPGQANSMVFRMMLLIYVFMVPIYLLAWSVWKCTVINHVYNHTKLDHVHFQVDLRSFSYWGVMLSNAVVAFLTIGLAIPWTKVRMLRYQLSCTTVKGNLDVFTGRSNECPTATAEEMGDGFGIELGF